MKSFPFLQEKNIFSCKSFVNNYLIDKPKSIAEEPNRHFMNRFVFSALLFLFFAFSGYAQKDKDIVPVIECVKELGNGLYQATFGYDNPTKKEVVIDESGSIIKTNNGKKVAKGLNKFDPGTNNKTFTKEFGPGDFVEWTIVSNGNMHTVIANANSAKCEPADGFIFPVIGNGKSYKLIGQELSSFCDNLVGETPSELIYQLKEDKVLVEIIPIDLLQTDVIDLLKGTPFNIPDQDFLLYDPLKPSTPYDFLAGFSAIDVYIATDLVCFLSDYPLLINFARPVYPSIKHAFGDGFTGLAVSQGDATQGSDVVRESFRLINSEGTVLPVDGSGITVGVMSNSYDTQPVSSDNLSRATVDVIQGDLPGVENTHGYEEPVVVLKEYPYGTASDEGRAMMHIVHDVAPGAKLAFHTSSLSPRNFEEGFKALAGLNDKNLKSNIIVDDITFITEPFFGDGRISEAIKAFTAAGGMHFTSAGNFGNHGYQGIFTSSSNVPATNFIDTGSPTKAHLFDGPGGTDYLQKISVVPGTYLIVLQWKEDAASQFNSAGAQDDLDIYIVDDLGRLLVGSNRVNIAGDPTEIIVFRATGTGEANILITSANGNTTVPFRYIAFQSDGLTLVQYDAGTPTVSGHAMTEESVTVGAIRYNQTEPESFSSFGGSLMDGTEVKVDFAAPDGVDTNVISIGQKYFSSGVPVDGTDYPNFFGTSASAPSAAAAVALLQSALPTWYPDASNPGKSTIGGDAVIQLFKDNVRDGSSPNIQAGAGMIDVNKVFNSLASQTARITSFEFVPETDSENASITTVKIKIIGEFLPVPSADDTYETYPIVYLDGVPVPYTIEGGVIYAEIPPFSGNPNLQIYTEPKEGSEGNGGFSEPYQFFQDGKSVITVTAQPLTVKFGQEYKSKLTYAVEGVVLPEGETSYEAVLSSLGFPSIALSTAVDGSNYPDINNYTITPDFVGEFADSDLDGIPDVYDQCPDTPSDAIVDANGCSDDQKGVEGFTPATTYKVNFIPGNLTINKNNLVIRPKDITDAVFGETIEIELEYSGYGTTDAEGNYTLDSINEPGLFLETIKAAHLRDFYTENAPGTTPVVLINNLFNNDSRYAEILNLLANGSWISSENSLLNRVSGLPNRVSGLPNRVSGLPNRVSGLPNFINIENSHFVDYLDSYLTNDPYITNRVSGLPNRVSGLANGEDILNGRVSALPNRVSGLPNAVYALENGTELASGTDTNDYSSVFAVFDIEDVPEDCGYDDLPPCTISKFYALNLITGLDVTTAGAPHYIFPGTFLEPMSDNFNITYEKAELTVVKADLTAETEALTVPYGGNIGELITTEFDYAYDDITESVYPDGIPYYFVKVTDEGGTPDTEEYTLEDHMDVGVYDIFIRDVAVNYNIKYGENHGTLTITEATLTVNTTTAANIKYGGSPVITTEFGDFAYSDENASTLFPDADGGIPYFFMKKGDTPDCDTCVKYYLPYVPNTDKMVVGEYDIFITDAPNDNYKIEYADARGTLTVDPATLTIKTTAFEVAYGDDVSESIVTEITGFAYADETVSTLFPDTDGGIPYLFVKGTDIGLHIDAVRELGVYAIEVEAPVNGNYVIDYDPVHGTLTIGEATLTFTPIDETIVYGDLINLSPGFSGFAYEDTESILMIGGKMPYYFEKDGESFTMEEVANMNVGVYEIFITDDLEDNYKFAPDTNLGTLTIAKATLGVSITPAESIVNQGDTPAFSATFSGYQNGDSESDVFPAGIPYYFVNDYGDYYGTDVPGAFTVRITDPTNYTMDYNNETTLFINPFNEDIKKVRTYSDCVAYNGPGDYTVTYRYENDNSDPVFVALGPDNNLSGVGYIGNMNELPTIFMPGSGTFEIDFNGDQLVWSLTSYEGTHKSSVSSASTSGSGECDAKLDGVYSLFPNPVTEGSLTITQNVAEVSTVYILDMYGRILKTDNGFNGINDTVIIDMSDGNRYPGGMYIVRIVALDQVRTYNIIKQ